MSINIPMDKLYDSVRKAKAGWKLAVVAPYDPVVMATVEKAAADGLINPWLIGDPDKIKKCLAETSLAEKDVTIVPALGGNPADTACSLIQRKECQMLMKGSIHTDDLLKAVIQHKLVLPGKKITHIYLIHRPDGNTLFLSDPSIFIHPTIAEKVHITENMIDCLTRLGLTKPRIAVLSSVETVNPKIPSSVDANELTKLFAGREDCTVFGPLGLDNAVSPLAASLKQIDSAVAGNADALILPNLDAGNLLSKGLIYIAGLPAAGILYGTACPVVFTSRSADEGERMRTLYLAGLYKNMLDSVEDFKK